MLRNPDYTQVSYQYDPAGRLLSRVTANGARMTQSFDANGWLTRLAQYDAANGLISDTSYTRDRVGNILTEADSVGINSGTTTYTLDALYRIKTADYPGTANDEAFDYDKVGNIKITTKGALAANTTTSRYYNYTAGTNRLLDIRIGSTSGTVDSSFNLDFEGRLTSQTGTGAKTLTWDAKGRVKTVGTEAYSYDPMDYRIGRSGGTLGNRSYFLEGEHLESEYSGSQLQAKYFRGSNIDELVAAWMFDTDSKLKPYLYHQNQLTSTTAITGHNGGTTQAIKYSAFGEVQSSTGSSPNRLGFTGREDDGNGLMHYRGRYYDPAVKRFVSEDPLRYAAGSMSMFDYAGNNGVNANDPMGLELRFANDAARRVVGDALTRAAVVPSNFAARDAIEAADLSRAITTISLNNRGAQEIIPRFSKGGDYLGGSLTVDPNNRPNIFVRNTSSGAYSVEQASLTRIVFHELGHTDYSNRKDFASAGYMNNINASENPAASPFDGFLRVAYPTFNDSYKGRVFNTDQAIDIFRQNNINTAPLTSRFGSDFGAAGGFLLYPNKPNNNATQSVYAK